MRPSEYIQIFALLFYVICGKFLVICIEITKRKFQASLFCWTICSRHFTSLWNDKGKGDWNFSRVNLLSRMGPTNFNILPSLIALQEYKEEMERQHLGWGQILTLKLVIYFTMKHLTWPTLLSQAANEDHKSFFHFGELSHWSHDSVKVTKLWTPAYTQLATCLHPAGPLPSPSWHLAYTQLDPCLQTWSTCIIILSN